MSQPNGYKPRHVRVEGPKHRANVPVDERENPFFTARHCRAADKPQPMCDHLHPIPWADRPVPMGVSR